MGEEKNVDQPPLAGFEQYGVYLAPIDPALFTGCDGCE